MEIFEVKKEEVSDKGEWVDALEKEHNLYSLASSDSSLPGRVTIYFIILDTFSFLDRLHITKANYLHAA